MAANQIVAKVQNRITELEKGDNGLSLPPNYSLGNALNSAWLMISDDPKLMGTDDNSKTQTLLNMAIQGLSPAKSQGYFIPYGKKLTFQRSYFGDVAIVQRLDNVKGKPFAQVIHQDDEFEIGADELGRMNVEKFKPKFENMDKPIVGAFAVIQTMDDEKSVTVMTKKMIDQSWSHARTNKVQNEFSDEMAKRTVIRRAAKMFINTSDDNDNLIKAINETANDEMDFDDERKDVTPEDSVAGQLTNKFISKKTTNEDKSVLDDVTNKKSESEGTVDAQDTNENEESHVEQGELLRSVH